MKSLKFSDSLPRLILEGKKNTTWRIDNNKNIKENDELSLCNVGGKEFAKAKVISVKEIKFKDLTKEDKEGHEKFLSNDEMYKTYSRYYNKEVNENTILKVIKFKVL